MQSGCNAVAWPLRNRYNAQRSLNERPTAITDQPETVGLKGRREALSGHEMRSLSPTAWPMMGMAFHGVQRKLQNPLLTSRFAVGFLLS